MRPGAWLALLLAWIVSSSADSYFANWTDATTYSSTVAGVTAEPLNFNGVTYVACNHQICARGWSSGIPSPTVGISAGFLLAPGYFVNFCVEVVGTQCGGENTTIYAYWRYDDGTWQEEAYSGENPETGLVDAKIGPFAIPATDVTRQFTLAVAFLAPSTSTVCSIQDIQIRGYVLSGFYGTTGNTSLSTNPYFYYDADSIASYIIAVALLSVLLFILCCFVTCCIGYGRRRRKQRVKEELEKQRLSNERAAVRRIQRQREQQRRAANRPDEELSNYEYEDDSDSPRPPRRGSGASASASSRPAIAPITLNTPKHIEAAQTTAAPAQPQVERPAGAIGCWVGCKRDKHIGSFVMSVVCWACWLAIFYGLATGDPLNVVPISILSIFTLFYWLESCMSPTRQYLSNIFTTESAVQYVDRIKTVPPYISFHVQCYHIEIRREEITETDSYGNRTTRIKETEVEVVTYSDSESFKFDSWQDRSPALVGVDDFDVTKVDFDKTYFCADTYTERKFNAQYADLESRNRYRDTHIRTWQVFHISGFKERLLALVDLQRRPPLLYMRWYVLLSFLYMTWPYRVWLSAISYKVNYRFVKSIRCTPPNS